MSVIPLTLFFSLLLAGLFMALFAREQWRRRFTSPERDSLLPLAEETPHTIEPPEAAQPVHDHAHEDHDHHDHEGHDHAGGCGCRNGTRPPCVGCLKRISKPSPISP